MMTSSYRNNLFSYDQFINSSFDELERLARKEGGPKEHLFPMIVKTIKVIMVHGYRYGHLSNTEQIKGKTKN